ncbi:MAG: hypothetical protein RBR67_14910 [Desulfobacterium sp.]|nr:hypothetical protein [Desulfobacterium sp.]
MGKINFTITLTSDGEPGSGFGTELIDSLIPRDIHGRVILPATHLKGLIRENLENLPDEVVSVQNIAELFGAEGDTGALFHIDNGVASKGADIIDITRTKLNKFGLADEGSLRTGEAVACGTCFQGGITTHCRLSKPYEDLLKLGLLSLFAVGGGRNRGAGACFVTLENENRTPGELVRTLAKIDFDDLPATTPLKDPGMAIVDDQVTLKLVFEAQNPVCVPEIPIVKNNMISSGFSIPASAVQGAILHRINDISEKAATACFKSRNFRAWPLNPSNSADALSLRVSFTHKISKLKVENTDNYHFEDAAVEAYDWDKVPSNSPLKAADGVLLAEGTSVKLWKSSDMARIITAHGVHNGDREGRKGTQKRNLFTVESLAPTLFTGIVSMPESAADILLTSLKADPFVQLGKSRSVRGGGNLSAQKIDFADLPIMKQRVKKVFIVQSPVLVPQSLVKKPVEEIISTLVEEAGFGEVEESSGSITTHFGWNRTVNNGFLGGKSVIAPGAVFKLKASVENLTEKLISGIGEGRENGLGAILPHPGVAQRLFPDEPEPMVLPKTDENYGLQGFELWQQAKASGLSASQVSRIRELAALDADKAVKYLDRQLQERSESIWQRWRDIGSKVREGIQRDAQHMAKVLKVCQDLLVADKEER